VSRLTDLIAQTKAKDPQLGADLDREFKVLSSRLPFGLNFERHRPEAVELPLRAIRKGDKVRVLPPRGSTKGGDQRLWQVKAIHKAKNVAVLELLGATETETQSVSLDDLVVVAEFRDTISPGLVSTGKVQRGGEKPFHTVINGENYHVLKALTYTHRGMVDAIYIDPPYNTGARDWKYNNDYVEGDDLYRHSKWLAMMERRLLVARELLNPADSVLIVTIDEKEVHRLGLLLEQLFPEGQTQMVTTVINPKGSTRGRELARVDEYLLILYMGNARALPTKRELLANSISSSSGKTPQIWYPLIRSGTDVRREDSKNGFYPIYIDRLEGRVVEVGEPLLPVTRTRASVSDRPGLIAVWPTLADGSDGRWQVSYRRLPDLVADGMVRVGRVNSRTKQVSITYLKSGEIDRIRTAEIESLGRDDNGVLQLRYADLASRERVGKTVWNSTAHDAGEHGTKLLRNLLPGRKFPFPKALYAVEDALRFFVKDKTNAVILDFFSGSGTTAHAVMRLNHEDGGNRQSISVTNNEVAAEQQKALREQGLRPGDPDWEKWGICDYIAKPRIEVAISGKIPDGQPIKGDYKFTDEFPMADGFEENAEFFTLTYEAKHAVNHNLAFARIAPLLWLRAGACGTRIDKLPADGWAVAETYGLLTEVDKATPFTKAVTKAKDLRIAYIVTDDDRRFQAVARRLAANVEPVRLYESYLTNFSFANGE
jgi:adenine-specific DNA-methyltransferase